MSTTESEDVWHVEFDDESPESVEASEVSAVEPSQVSAVDSE